MASIKQPLSIEALVSAKKQAELEASKPQFLSKADRAALALARRAEEVRDKQEQEQKAQNERAALEQAARNSAPVPPTASTSLDRPAGSYDGPPSGPRGGFRGRGRGGRGRFDDRRDDDRRRDDRRNGSMQPPSAPAAQNDGHVNGTTSNGAASSSEPVINRAALEARYLGGAHIKKKPRKQSDKKFTFDWEGTDDTGAAEVDPLYKAGGSAYGAVRLAGVDPSLHAERPVARVAAQADPQDVPLAGPSTLARKAGARSGAMDERHWTEKGLAEMRDRDWRILREDFNIAARGGQIPHPMRFWTESTIPPTILDIIEQIGYKDPSPIQRIAIPLGLQNRDTIGIAETGSGKTAAFLIPMLDYITRVPPLTDDNRAKGPYALVLAPTRELAQQIEQEAIKFTLGLGFKCVSIVGGKSVEGQSFDLRNGAEIIIATPGRLKDCIERSIVVLGQCSYVVMDEADRMVSLGFEEVINFILDSLPVSNEKPDNDDAMDSDKMRGVINAMGQRQLYRQTFMFSATMPPAVERLAKSYMRRPAIVTIGVAGQAVDTVEQKVEFFTNEEKKKNRLLDILANDGYTPPIIVFVNQKRGADMLARDLQRARWSATTLHADKNQEQREAALASLRSGEVDILVATDLASRGIDVPDVSLVLNYQMANTIEAYVHRIGRSGRAGKHGTAITFLMDKDDSEILYDLKAEINKSPISKVPVELAKHQAAQNKMTSSMKRQLAELEEA